jgi:hypothetical protein
MDVRAVFGYPIASGNGMGKWTVAGGFVDGSAVDDTKYGMLKPVLVVTGGGFTAESSIEVLVTGKNHWGSSPTVWHYTGGLTLPNGTYYFVEAPESGPQTQWIRDVTSITLTPDVTGPGTATVHGLRQRNL